MADENSKKTQNQEGETGKKEGFIQGTWRRTKNGFGWLIFGLTLGALGSFAVLSGRKASEESGGSSDETSEEDAENSEESSDSEE